MSKLKPMNAAERVLWALKEHRKRGCSSVQLAFVTGVRNVPDAVSRLREQGWRIDCRMGPVTWQFRVYPSIGTYRLVGKRG